PKLETGTPHECDAAFERHVDIEEARATQNVAPGISECARRHSLERRHVVPGVDCLLPFAVADLVWQPGHEDTDVVAGLDDRDPGTRTTGRDAAETHRKRQIDDPARADAVPGVLVCRPFPRVTVSRILREARRAAAEKMLAGVVGCFRQRVADAVPVSL